MRRAALLLALAGLLAPAAIATDTGSVRSADADPFAKGCGSSEYGVLYHPDGTLFCCESTTQKWRPCAFTSNDSCDMRWWGVTCDDSTDTSSAFQDAVDGCADAGYAVAQIPSQRGGVCKMGTTTIRLDEPITLRGHGGGSAWWTQPAAQDKAGTILEWADNMDDAAILVGGCPTTEDATRCATPRGYWDGGVNYGAEGVRIEHLRIKTPTEGQEATCGGGSAQCRMTGIQFDAAYIGATCEPTAGTACTSDLDCTGGDTCDPDPAGDRAGLRSSGVRDVSVMTAGTAFALHGNVFDVDLTEALAYNVSHGVRCLGKNEGYKGPGASRCGQIDIFRSRMYACDPGLYSWCVADPIAYDVQYTRLFGGRAQGSGTGIRAGFGTNVFGTHIEMCNDDGCTHETIGVNIVGRYVALYPKTIADVDVALLVGDPDATSEPTDDFFAVLPTIANADLGVKTLTGGLRDGIVHVGGWNSVTVQYEDNRGLGELKTGIVAADVTGDVDVPALTAAGALTSSAGEVVSRNTLGPGNALFKAQAPTSYTAGLRFYGEGTGDKYRWGFNRDNDLDADLELWACDGGTGTAVCSQVLNWDRDDAEVAGGDRRGLVEFMVPEFEIGYAGLNSIAQVKGSTASIELEDTDTSILGYRVNTNCPATDTCTTTVSVNGTTIYRIEVTP